MLLPVGLSASPTGQLLYLIPLASLVKSTRRRSFDLGGTAEDGDPRGGNLHPSPEDAKTLGVLLRMGFVLLLEGAGLSALRSSLWGEQQEHYVGSTHAANHARIPGVSRVIPRNTALSAVCGRCIARLPVPGSGSRPPPSEAHTPAGLRHPAAQDRAPARSGPATSARTLKPWTS